jgi:hypothetical protein
LIPPGVGEVIAAKRLLGRVLQHYGRFFDVVLGDILYSEALSFKFCIGPPFFDLYASIPSINCDLTPGVQ